MLKIGEFSKLSRVSIRMLRHYDEIGLLAPGEIDRFTGYRYYREEQLLTAGRVTALKDMGFQLAAIREILKIYDDTEALDRTLCLKQAELRELSDETAQRLRLLDTARGWLRKDAKNMKHNVTLKTIPERYAASVRMVIPRYDAEGMLWDVLNTETADMNLIPDDPCLCYAVYLDNEHKETDVDVEVQKTVKGRYPDTEHVRFKTEPAVTVASAVYHGSYMGLNDVNEAVAAWIRDNGYQLNGPAFFIYHVSPYETQNPDEFVTEVCYPVQKK